MLVADDCQSPRCIFFCCSSHFYLMKIYLLIHLSVTSFLPFIHYLPHLYSQFVSFPALTRYLGLGFDILQASLEPAG